VQATVTGLDASTNRKSVMVAISGEVPTRFEPAAKVRAELDVFNAAHRN